jgi:RND family efflux transporter MFP subunit
MLLVASLSLGLLAGCSKSQPPKPIRPVLTTVIGDVSQISERPFSGSATASEEAVLSFRVGGPLKQLPVNVGDEVEAGQVLAELDPNDFEVALRATQGELSAAEAAYTAAEADYERVINVQKEDPGATSQRAVDLALSLRDQAKSTVAALRAVVQTARDRLHYTTLEAPFSGTVVSKYVENFEDVLPKQNVLKISNVARIEFTIDVPETLISYHPYVEDVQIRFDVQPDRPVPATIYEIGTEANPNTRTFPVTLILDQPVDFDVLPGMSGQALVSAKLPEDAGKTGIEVPTSAVFSDDDSGKTFLWVVDESANVVQRREVAMIGFGEFGILLESGVTPGERIATAGVHFLSDGQKIKVVDAAAEAGPKS